MLRVSSVCNSSQSCVDQQAQRECTLCAVRSVRSYPFKGMMSQKSSLYMNHNDSSKMTNTILGFEEVSRCATSGQEVGEQ